MALRPPSKDVNRESCTCPLSSPAAVCPMCYSGASDCSDVEYPVHSDTVTVVEQAKASGRYCLTSSAMPFEIRYLRSVLLTLNLRVVFFLMPGLIPLQYVHSDDLMFKHDSCKPRACDPAGARHYLPVRAAFDRFEETDRCAIKVVESRADQTGTSHHVPAFFTWRRACQTQVPIKPDIRRKSTSRLAE